MAKYKRRTGAGLRIFVLFLLVIVLSLGGILWFDYLGIFDAKGTFAPILNFVGFKVRTKVENIDDPLLLDRERVRKQQEAMEIRAAELEKMNEELKKKEAELVQLAADLEEKDRSLSDREKSFNEKEKAYENKVANVEQNARYLVNMPPASAKEILLKMDDQDIIDVLRTTERLAAQSGEDSIVPYWLSLMPADRAAALQRKMASKPGS